LSERLERNRDQSGPLVLEGCALVIRGLKATLFLLTSLVAEQDGMLRRRSVEQLGPAMRGRGSAVSSESPFQLLSASSHGTSSRAEGSRPADD
jgi:hypothetical protein